MEDENELIKYSHGCQKLKWHHAFCMEYTDKNRAKAKGDMVWTSTLNYIKADLQTDLSLCFTAKSIYSGDEYLVHMRKRC